MDVASLLAQIAELQGENARERARANAAEAGAASAYKETFFTQMRAISSSSSADTASNTDEVRRGAPTAIEVSFDEVLGGTSPPELDVASMWASFAAKHSREWTARNTAVAADLKEVRDVHPTVGMLLASVVPAEELRVFHDAFAEDDVAVGRIKPDFTVTHVRDSASSTVGGLILIEVKLPGDMVDALRQIRAYLRRRVYKLCCEKDARGEACDDVFALGVATDGVQVAFVRVSSGAPAAGGSFDGRKPCPIIETGCFDLLPGWTYKSDPAPAFSERPHAPGYAMLARLFHSSGLGGGAPLLSLRVRNPDSDDDIPSEELLFSERLGCGGSSDAYLETGGNVVKVARTYTVDVRASFDSETTALAALRDEAARGLVPDLLASRVRAGGGGAWPVLIMRPRGQQLAHWVNEAVERRDISTSDAASVRKRCASRVTLRILDALQSAHAKSIIHCDVRPSNIVVVDGEAMLVDWGASCRAGDDAFACGVAAYTTACVFEQKSYAARPAQDIAGALYTWIAIAFSGSCTAPWLHGLHIRGDASSMYEARGTWIAGGRSKFAEIAALIDYIDAHPRFDKHEVARAAVLDEMAKLD